MRLHKRLLCNNAFVFTSALLLVSLNYGRDKVCGGPTSSATNGVENKATLCNLVSRITQNQTRGFSSAIKTNACGEIIGVALYGQDISQTNIVLIAAIPTLETFCLGCCTNETNIINEQAFAALNRAKRLETLEIYGGVPLLTTSMCKAISALPRLQNLKIEFCMIENGGKQYLLQVKRLRTLKLPDENQ